MNPLYHFLSGSYPERSIQSVLRLLESGSTVPFIARYRKENTGNLDEIQIRDIANAQAKLEELTQRQQTIIKAIDEQGKLDGKLEGRILNCFNPTELEDLYLPYKKRRKTKADVARELGLEGLAKIVMTQSNNVIKDAAQRFTSSKVQN